MESAPTFSANSLMFMIPYTNHHCGKGHSTKK
jgi:hypothetical protein